MRIIDRVAHALHARKIVLAVVTLFLAALVLSACGAQRGTDSELPVDAQSQPAQSTDASVEEEAAAEDDEHEEEAGEHVEDDEHAADEHAEESDEHVEGDAHAADEHAEESDEHVDGDEHVADEHAEESDEHVEGDGHAADEHAEEADEHMEDDAHATDDHGPAEHMSGSHGVPPEAAAVANPISAANESIERGAATFALSCAVCHGETGEGDGPGAAALDPKPADLHADHVQGNTDGALYWIITHGREDTAMPPWDNIVQEEDRWHLVNFIRSLSDRQ